MLEASNPPCKLFIPVWLRFPRCSWRSSIGTVCPIAVRSPVFWARLISRVWMHYGACFRTIWWPEPRLALLGVDVFDRLGPDFLVIDVDGTKQAPRQRALPQTTDLPAP